MNLINISDDEQQQRAALNISVRHRATADRYYLAALLQALRPNVRPMYAAIDAAALESAGAAYSRIKVAECGRELTGRDRARAVTYRKRAVQVAAFYGLKIDNDGGGLGLVLIGAALFPLTAGTTLALGDK